jgi:plastocyanin domain-containing protein
MFYEDVFRKLGERKVRYAVAGGVALVLHGIVRMTADLDLIVDLSTENLDAFTSAVGDLGFKPRLPVKTEDFSDPATRQRWIDEKGMKVFTFYHPERQINQIDVFVTEVIPFSEIQREIVWIRAKDISIPVVSLSHLKKLKEISGRPQDIADIEAIEELRSINNEGDQSN